MNRLIIRFPKQNIEINAVPEQPVTLRAMARHKRKIILLAADGRLFCASFFSKGVAICEWDTYTALDYLPMLSRLGCLPKGITIKAAKQKVAAKEKSAARRRRRFELQSLCHYFGVKAPKVK